MDVSLATSLGNILNSMTLWVQKGLAVLDIAYDTAKGAFTI